MGEPIELIAGLGNPDPEYLMTRHNAGFWFVDALAAAESAAFKADKKVHGHTTEVRIGSCRVRLLKPMTYMNRSGRAVAATLHYYKIPVERLLVVYDELDLPAGRAQLKRPGGGHAGHNGVRDVIEHVGPDFWRIRVGVGRPGFGDRRAVLGHVLKRAGADEDLILETIRAGLDTLPILLEHGAQRAQTHLHSFKPAAVVDGDDAGTP